MCILTLQTLLSHGACDHDNQALRAAAKQDERLACRLLCNQVFTDPEYRVNKSGVEVVGGKGNIFL